MDKLFDIEHLRCSYDKHYREGISKVVMKIDKISFPKGKKIFIVGESGIGKSTILELLGMMNYTIIPNNSTKFVFYDENQNPVDLIAMWKRNRDRELSDFRRRYFNFIFQSTNLMKNFTAYENISITRMLQGFTQTESFKKAEEVLADLGLGHIAQERMAQELSGGQQQRLAFARAVIPDFMVLFGDEPTGNLDSENAARAMELLTLRLKEYKDRSAVIVSHDMHLAVRFGDMVIKINKVSNAKKVSDDEVTYFGHIDEDCAYFPSADRTIWSNGKDSYSDIEFENFLKNS